MIIGTDTKRAEQCDTTESNILHLVVRLRRALDVLRTFILLHRRCRKLIQHHCPRQQARKHPTMINQISRLDGETCPGCWSSGLRCFEYLGASSDRLIVDDIPAICRTMIGQRCRIPAGVFKASPSFDSQSRPKECQIAKTLARFATDSTITAEHHIGGGGDLLRRSQLSKHSFWTTCLLARARQTRL